MSTAPGPTHTDHQGCIVILFLLGVLVVGSCSFVLALLTSKNMLIAALSSILSIIPAASGFLQISVIFKHVRNFFLPFLKKLRPSSQHMVKSLVHLARKTGGYALCILFIIILLIKDFAPSPQTHQKPIASTPENGIYITSMSVDAGKTNMNIGLLDNSNKGQGPFNQYDANNNEAEWDLENNKIFAENQHCHHPSHATLIVATALSQTVADPHLSSNVGLDTLRGAYMAQYNFDHDPSQRFCLHLIIANFGTKGVTEQTVPIVMKQINAYVLSNPQHFMGVVGLPFSVSVVPALYNRLRLDGQVIPVISSAAVAEDFAQVNTSPPDYTNFYRVVSPVSQESQVLEDFITNYAGGYLSPLQTQTVLFEDPHDTYSRSLGRAIFQKFPGVQEIDYTMEQPDSIIKGIDPYIASHQGRPFQIFFAGYGDDLTVLKNRLAVERSEGLFKQATVHIIGGGGLYDLGSYDTSSYANLFFTIRASYAAVNAASQGDGIPIPFTPHPSSVDPWYYQEPFNWEFRLLFHQDDAPSPYGSDLAGTNVLLMYDAIQAYLMDWKHSGEATSPSIWQTIIGHWSDVQFEGVSGKIQFPPDSASQPNNPENKPMYVACTDKHGYTHVVGTYDMDGSQLQFTSRAGQLEQCLNQS